MDDKELMEHISHILYYGNERNIELSLTQLWDILKKNDAPAGQIRLMEMALGATQKLADLAVLKYGEKITERDIERTLDRVYRYRRGGRY